MKHNKSKIIQIIGLLQKYYKSKNVVAIQRLIRKNQLNTIVKSIEAIEDIDVVIFILMALSTTKHNNIFRFFSDELQRNIIQETNNNQLKIILKYLYPDEILDIANKNDDLFKKILLCLTSKQRSLIKEISKFENDEAGSIMNPDYISFNDNYTIKECINIYKHAFDKIEGNLSFFVTSSNKKLIGQVQIQALFFADDTSKTVDTIMEQNVMYVHPTDDVEEIISIIQDYNLPTLPVVDNEGVLVGIINDNDILPAIEEETTEDIYHMYGIQKLNDSYIKSTVWSIVKSRLFWVLILMISATLTSIVIDRFENWGISVTLGLSTVLLVPIIPVITGTSGNTGSQSAATVIRALAVGEITRKEYKKVIIKEFQIGLLLGGLLSLFNMARLAAYFAIPAFRDISNTNAIGNLNITDTYAIAMIASTASSISLWIAVMLSKLLGSILPLVAIRFKIDPTVMSTPLIATTVDVCSTSILFAVGIGLLSLVVH